MPSVTKDVLQDNHRSRTFVNGFARGLALIEAFGSENPRMSVAEAATRLNLDRAVTRRLLLTLVELGFARVDRKQFELTPNILRLGYGYLSSVGLDGTVQPDLDDLSRHLGETVSLSILDDESVVFVARSEARGRRMIDIVNQGMRLPAFATSSGRILLSVLPDEEIKLRLKNATIKSFTEHTVTSRTKLLKIIQTARETGYAINDQEIEAGVLGISVLVRSRSGQFVASLTSSGSSSRTAPEAITRKVIPALKKCAGKLSKLLL